LLKVKEEIEQELRQETSELKAEIMEKDLKIK